MPLKIQQHDDMPALNLTSMIDVLFLLIIFFMVATKFDEMERNIQVAVPTTPAQFRAKINADLERWSPIIKTLDLKIN